MARCASTSVRPCVHDPPVRLPQVGTRFPGSVIVDSTSPLRAAIVGAGLMGRWHADALTRAGGRLVAVADRDLAAARRLASAHGGADSLDDVDHLLSDYRLNVLHVCTPSASHSSIVQRAIEAGVDVIVEKPVTPTASETEHVYRLAEQRGVIVCPVHQFVFQDGVLQARAWLPRIGRLVSVESHFYSAGGVGRSETELDDIAADILPHPLALGQAFLGDLEATEWMAVRPAHGELRILGQHQAVAVSIQISLSGRPTQSAMAIVGTAGSLHLNLFHGYAFVEPGDVSRMRKIALPFEQAARQLAAAGANLARRVIDWEPAYPGLRRLIRLCYAAVRRAAAPPISPAEAIAVARVREQLMKQVGMSIVRRTS